MYTPAANRVTDLAKIRAFIHAHGFATLITTAPDDSPFASHLPVLLDENSASQPTLVGDVLRSHMARANPQWQHFSPEREVLCIFHGPHAYISPTWYATPSAAVPTWNYATVHVYGRPRIETDPARLRQIVDDTTSKYEAHQPMPWRMTMPESQAAGMLNAIVGFTLEITRVEAKFKLGQNRSLADQASMLAALSASPLPDAQALAHFIRENS